MGMDFISKYMEMFPVDGDFFPVWVAADNPGKS